MAYIQIGMSPNSIQSFRQLVDTGRFTNLKQKVLFALGLVGSANYHLLHELTGIPKHILSGVITNLRGEDKIVIAEVQVNPKTNRTVNHYRIKKKGDH